jgi:hypothetical protein
MGADMQAAAPVPAGPPPIGDLLAQLGG